MNATFVVFFKELVDGLRDRRSLASLLIFPLVGPVLVSLMLTKTAEDIAGTERTEVAVVGREHAPALMQFLEDRRITILEAPADPVAATEAGDVDAVLVIPDDYGERFRAGKPVKLDLIFDRSRQSAMATVARVRRNVQGYAGQVGTLRLLAHGVHPDLGQPLVVAEVDVATAKKRAAVVLNLIPMFVLLAAFIGGMYTATDATAGERERGSLEPLLLTPVPRRILVVGKWLVAALFSAATVVLTLFVTLAAVHIIPTEKLGLVIQIGPADVALVLVAVLPLALFVPAAQMLVASFARSFKEAQTYLSLMMFVPMIPALFLSTGPIVSEGWMAMIPVFGQQVILGDLFKGEAVPVLSYVLAAASTGLAGWLCLRVTGHLFQRESIIYGR
ncbi:MAG: ABC transporter permease [Myxococcales bacterium]|nr:ABC transporter permease [Myxococcales bacterium]